MATTEPVSEDDLESTLRTDPDYAIELLDLCYQEQIVQYISKRPVRGQMAVRR